MARPDQDSDFEMYRSEAFAAMGHYPNRSPCPVGCKFCYERSLPEFYPNLKVARVRPRTEDQFDFFTAKLAEYQQSAIPISPVVLEPTGMVTYTSNSDFFAQGLTKEQLDRVVAANTATGTAPYVSTMGKGFDFETAKFLQERHPDAFRVRLSLLTYNDEIKATLIPKWETSTDMRKITTILRDANIYLLHFNVEQTLSDLREVNHLANTSHKPRVGIAVVHYTRKHSPLVQRYAEDGFADFETLIRYLMSGKERFENITEITFQHPAEAFTFRFRGFLRDALAPLHLGESDLILCSHGALRVMRDLVVRNGAEVRSVRDGLGGSTTFTTTLCTDDFLRDLGAILAERRDVPFRRVLVPQPVWWVGDPTAAQGLRCLNGGSVDDLRRAFPTVEFVPIHVPLDVLETRLTVRQAYDFYNADLEKTRDLLSNRRDVLAQCLRPNESLTDLGFVRRFVLEGDEAHALDPATLETLDPSARVLVEYDELIVEREDLFPPEGRDERVGIPSTSTGVAPIYVRRTFVKRHELPSRYMRSLFFDLFVVKRPLAEVSRSALGDLPRRIHRALADLELAKPVTRPKRRLPLSLSR